MGEPRRKQGQRTRALRVARGVADGECATHWAVAPGRAWSADLEVVANNIANMNTTGFKSDSAMFEEYLNVRRAGHALPGRQHVACQLRARSRHLARLQPGPMQPTGNPLDVAINGDGFLAVQTPDGERYTRNGAMQINAQWAARHDRRHAGARRKRADHVSAQRPQHRHFEGRPHHRQRRRQYQDGRFSRKITTRSIRASRSSCTRTGPTIFSRRPA